MTAAPEKIRPVSAGQRVLESLNPADGSLVASYPIAGDAEAEHVVAAARAASGWWQDQGFAGRGRHLSAWRKYIWRNVDELAELVHRENGKTVDDAILEIALAVEHLHWAEHHAAKALKARSIFPGILLSNFAATVEYRPYGVVGIIGPWNYPVYSPNSSSAYALAAGNTVVLKPSEFTPAVGAWYVEAFHLANPDAPRGVFQVLIGDGSTGAALIRAGVDKVGFTGSTRTGSKIMAACAGTLTPLLLECGGKDPVIVAADADLRSAAEAVAWGAYSNAGQTCVGVERVYVERTVRDEFIALLRVQLEGVRSGSDARASYGPMTMPSQVEIVRRHVRDAIESGGQALVGGLDSVGERGIEPVLILDASEDCSAVREETFGPTLTLRTVDSVDEAVELANAHQYGLSASVFSRGSAKAIASRLKAGQVSLNSVIAFAGMGAAPMGGVGASGFGRVHGVEGLREFAYPRTAARKLFSIPGLELLSLHRAKRVVPLTRIMLNLRHR